MRDGETTIQSTSEVNTMLHTRKAPVSEEDVAGIVGYLAGLKVAP